MKIVDYQSVIDPERKIDWLAAEQMTESAKKLRETNNICYIFKTDEEPRILNIVKTKREEDR